MSLKRNDYLKDFLLNFGSSERKRIIQMWKIWIKFNWLNFRQMAICYRKPKSRMSSWVLVACSCMIPRTMISFTCLCQIRNKLWRIVIQKGWERKQPWTTSSYYPGLVIAKAVKWRAADRTSRARFPVQLLGFVLKIKPAQDLMSTQFLTQGLVGAICPGLKVQ
jgi:hypothetical protein